MPNDETELPRMMLAHQVHLQALDGALTTVTLQDPDLILDIGTGTGEWAICMGEQYPECEIVGTDISAIQETSVPPNVSFELEDAEISWDRLPSSVDFVHIRHLDGAFKSTSFVYEQAFACLRPGGWLERKEWDIDQCIAAVGVDSQTDNDSDRSSTSSKPKTAVGTLLDLGINAARAAGRPWADKALDAQPLIEAGFVDVQIVERAFCIGSDGPDGVTGRMWLISFLEGLEAIFLRLLVEHGGMDASEVRELCENSAEEMVSLAKDPNRGRSVYVNLRILTARKPLPDMRLVSESEDQLQIEKQQHEQGGKHDQGKPIIMSISTSGSSKKSRRRNRKGGPRPDQRPSAAERVAAILAQVEQQEEEEQRRMAATEENDTQDNSKPDAAE